MNPISSQAYRVLGVVLPFLLSACGIGGPGAYTQEQQAESVEESKPSDPAASGDPLWDSCDELQLGLERAERNLERLGIRFEQREIRGEGEDRSIRVILRESGAPSAEDRLDRMGQAYLAGRRYHQECEGVIDHAEHAHLARLKAEALAHKLRPIVFSKLAAELAGMQAWLASLGLSMEWQDLGGVRWVAYWRVASSRRVLREGAAPAPAALVTALKAYDSFVGGLDRRPLSDEFPRLPELLGTRPIVHALIRWMEENPRATGVGILDHTRDESLRILDQQYETCSRELEELGLRFLQNGGGAYDRDWMEIWQRETLALVDPTERELRFRAQKVALARFSRSVALLSRAAAEAGRSYFQWVEEPLLRKGVVDTLLAVMRDRPR